MSTLYAGFWRRAVALWIDSAVLSAASNLFVLGLLSWHGLSVSQAGGMQAQLLGVGAYACFAFLYYSVAHYQWGFTLGKRLLRVRVVDARTGERISAPQSMGRSVASAFSWLTFGIGFLMAAFDSRKRTLHDRVAFTVCLKRV